MKFLHIENSSSNIICNLDANLLIKITNSSDELKHISIIEINDAKNNFSFDLSKPQLDEFLSFLKNKETYFKCPTL